MHVAIVYSPRGVLLLSITPSRAARERALTAYVHAQALRQLSPSTRIEIVELIRRGAIPDAVRRYFEVIGHEWDDEWLHLDTLEDRSPIPVAERTLERARTGNVGEAWRT